MHLCNIRLIAQYYALRAMVEYKNSDRNANKEVRQEVLTALTVDITAFWNMMP